MFRRESHASKKCYFNVSNARMRHNFREFLLAVVNSRKLTDDAKLSRVNDMIMQLRGCDICKNNNAETVECESKQCVRVTSYGTKTRMCAQCRPKIDAESLEPLICKQCSDLKSGRKIQFRRMAQREFSDRRDSPVMTRLLNEIVAAQDNQDD